MHWQGTMCRGISSLRYLKPNGWMGSVRYGWEATITYMSSSPQMDGQVGKSTYCGGSPSTLWSTDWKHVTCTRFCCKRFKLSMRGFWCLEVWATDGDGFILWHTKGHCKDGAAVSLLTFDALSWLKTENIKPTNPSSISWYIACVLTSDEQMHNNEEHHLYSTSCWIST